MKCGNPVSAPVNQVKSVETAAVCPQCGKPLKPGGKFCMGCGAPVAQNTQPAAQAGQKGWFTDGVRTVANAVDSLHECFPHRYMSETERKVAAFYGVGTSK